MASKSGIALRQLSKEERDLCRLVTPTFRLSYPHLFKPHAMKGGKPKYSITMLFPKTKELVGTSPEGEERKVKSIIAKAKRGAFGDKENWPKGIESPIGDGDDPKYADKEGYAGHWILKASSSEDQRPEVVDKDMEPIERAADIYPGCFARAYIFAYVWEFAGRYGVGFILDHVQKVKDAKSFGGKKPINQIFSPVETDDEEETEEDDEENF